VTEKDTNNSLVSDNVRRSHPNVDDYYVFASSCGRLQSRYLDCLFHLYNRSVNVIVYGQSGAVVPVRRLRAEVFSIAASRKTVLDLHFNDKKRNSFFFFKQNYRSNQGHADCFFSHHYFSHQSHQVRFASRRAVVLSFIVYNLSDVEHIFTTRLSWFFETVMTSVSHKIYKAIRLVFKKRKKGTIKNR